MRRKRDLTGSTFGELRVMRPAGEERNPYWLCACRCGKETPIRGDRLTMGLKTDCGCRGKIERHGESASREYKTWARMNARTLRLESASSYRDRGITVCDRWRRSFSAFLADVGRKPSSGVYTLDRIDNDGNYEPGNVRWATPTQQQNNRRVCRKIDFQGKILSVKELAEYVGLNVHTLTSQLRKARMAGTIEQLIAALQAKFESKAEVMCG